MKKRQGQPCRFFGRSGGTRTRGLQYPKLARYQLRYTSKYLLQSLSQCIKYYTTLYVICQYFLKQNIFKDNGEFLSNFRHPIQRTFRCIFLQKT